MSRAEDQLVRRLESEVAGTLSLHVMALAKLQQDDTEGATELLESSVEQAVLTLPRQRSPDELPAAPRGALQAAQVYVSCFDSGITPEVRAVLRELPDPPRSFCSPLLKDMTPRPRLAEPHGSPKSGEP